jgi:hypothetical protein
MGGFGAASPLLTPYASIEEQHYLQNQEKSTNSLFYFFFPFLQIHLSLSLSTNLFSFFIGSMPPLLDVVLMVEERECCHCWWRWVMMVVDTLKKTLLLGEIDDAARS